ncbi:FAD-binding protein [Agromyces atrinae]|uniref:FAD-binding protein n=1 Tax=Agromyces atrinae TaxID=592376 RepID=A0A4Q2M1M5_9MICO|nr:D-arabinono-1,4-lactone oxidase [Agromyces atrinae]MCI2959328.1 FAD-binding protein [Agromyces atrinae]NYD68820.1 FAD-linked oxidoreductase [Agromyces atrinae]RXZ85114.1 FAD-binding protein [Agromyces atrinae]RXZ85805.1 FAD-binding protein [Agromyces atrinae]
MTATGSTWRNWARTETARPARVERPATPSAVQRAVRAAAAQGLGIKAVGAGHSFTGIAVAPGVLLDLTDLSGLLSVDRDTARATFLAGTRLHQLPALLAPYGLALANMGDIDRQSIAGATSTGTHGTGIGFGGLATQIVSVTLVDGTGEFVRVSESENAELLPAARLGLGALGIVVEVTLQLVPAYVLHAVERPESLDEVLGAWEERVRAADHFEFYWFPHTDRALTKTNTRLPADAPLKPLGRVGRWVDDELLANGLYRATCALGTAVPAIVPRFAKIVDRVTGNREFTDLSPNVFVTNRTVRFKEMEYAIPLAEVPAALAEIRALIDERGWRISFPLEIRAAAADDNWLSTAYGRESGYIAVHRYYREDEREYFAAVEAILFGRGGRPHWGKMHSLGAEELASIYPRFDDFRAIRDLLDPAGLFTNAYLRRVLGNPSAESADGRATHAFPAEG